MGDKSRIEWTDATWTPIRARRRDTGKVGVHCERVSPACANCYAAAHNRRNLPVHGTGLDFTIPNREKVEIFVDEKILLQPLRWRRGRRIFVCSQTDLFADFVTDEMIDRVFAVMSLCPQHTFQVLTKRPERMLQWTKGIDDNEGGRLIGKCYRDSLIEGEAQNIYCKLHPAADPSEWLAVHQPLPNVWLGTTVENQEWADKRIPVLLQTPAAKRFVSVEPMLGPVDLRSIRWNELDNLNYLDVLRGGLHHPVVGFIPQGINTLDWVICGGESGHGARPMHPDWARSLRDQCQAAGVPFFFKQWGEWEPKDHWNPAIPPSSQIAIYADGSAVGDYDNPDEVNGQRLWRVGKKSAGRLLDGREWSEFPGAVNG